MFSSRFTAVFLGTITLAASCTGAPAPAKTSLPAATTSPPKQVASTASPVPSSSSGAIVETNPSAVPTATTAPPPQPLPLEERLDKLGVTDQRFVRKDLYSWTTSEQIAKLRQTKTLLVATAKSRGGPSPYSSLLIRLSQGTGGSRDVAKLLSEHPGLTKRRYAWPAPFATSVPLGERSYGHALVHIVLKDKSFVAKLDPLENEVFSFVDLDNSAVATSEAIAHPERIAAVFHVRRKPDGGPRFREYIVCNESMIESWSIGMPHERVVVAENIALVDALLRSPLVTALDKDTPLDAASAWSSQSDKPTLLDAWRRALAFDSPKYKPSRDTLGAINTSLAAYDAAGDPLEHKPLVVFPNEP